MSEKKKNASDEVLGVTPSGTVITEELAEQWATEIESDDFDPTHWERLYVIPLPPIEGHTGPGIAFPLSSSELEDMRKRAEKEDRSFPDLLREALDS